MHKASSLLFILLLGFTTLLVGQEDAYSNIGGLSIQLDSIINDGKRDEIQRYIGYETLLARYITLPYDISVNTANQGRYFDIGYALLLIIPISLLLLFYRNKRIFYFLLLLLLTYLGIGKYYSFQNIPEVGSLNRNADNWASITGSVDFNIIDQVLFIFNDFCILIAKPAILLIEAISGAEDSTTYPVLIIILIIGIILLSKVQSIRPKQLKFFLTTIFIFIILWLILSGGIIWYGFISIPLLFMVSMKELKKNKSRMIIGIGIISLLPWIVMSFVSRVSNIEAYQPKDNWGKNILHNSLVPYSTGFVNAQETKNSVYNNVNQALEEINSSDAFVFQVGTSLSYEITKSTTRLMPDNTLDKFYLMLRIFGSPKDIIPAFKASGIEYIILDLYTPTLDKTPEKSLTNKYKLFIAALYESNNIKLLSTDRILTLTNDDGQGAQLSHIFAKGYGDKVDISLTNHGSYAIFQIL